MSASPQISRPNPRARPLMAALAALGLMATAAAQAATFGSPSRVDEDFGKAVREAMARQTLNPHAGHDPLLPATQDGVMARAALQRLRQSYVNPPTEAQSRVIGTGSAGAGGMGR